MRFFSLIKFLLALSILTGCSCFEPFSNDCAPCATGGSGYDIPEAPYVDLPSPVLSIHAEEITAIIQDYSVELKNFKHLYLQHANTYYNDAGIHTIQLSYISQDLLELCDARKLIIDVSEGLLDQLNSNPLLIPEFTNRAFYPFNLEIYINFESFFAKYIDPFYVKWIMMEDAKIAFYTADVNDNDKLCWHARKEAYDTSRDIVFYQRLAEDKFKAMYEPDRAVFGEKRYYPD
jgi:hypothetical protein